MKNSTQYMVAVVVVSLVTVVAACGGEDTPDPSDAATMPDAAGAQDAGPDAAPPEPLPEVRFVFPPRDALTDQSTVRVRGIAPDDGSIASVTIDGALVTTTDGYATWEHTVALTPGANVISATATTTDGAVLEGVSQTVVYSPTSLTSPRDLTLDSALERAYVIEFDVPVIVEVEMATGAHQVVSSGAVGTGPLWTEPYQIGRSGAMLYVLARMLDGSAVTLLAVDAQSGDRVTIADPATGSGPMVTAPYEMVIDETSQRAYITDQDHPGVLAIELASGARSWLSDGSAGVGPALASPGALALDLANNSALVVDSARLLAIDLGSGDRSQLLSDFDARAVSLDVAPGSVLSRFATELRRTDLATGQTVRISGGEPEINDVTGAGPRLGSLNWPYPYLSVDAANQRAVVGPALTVDLTTGNRVAPWGFRATEPSAVVATEDAIVVGDVDHSTVWKFGLYGRASGNVSGFGRGAGEDLRHVIALSVDPVQGRVIYADHYGWDADASRSIVGAIDLLTGDRTVLSASNLASPVGSGTELDWMRGMTVDHAGNRALVSTTRDLGSSSGEPCARTALLQVDLTTGMREVFSGTEFSKDPADMCAPDVGEGPVQTFQSSASVAGEPYILATDIASLLRVDLATGDRTLLSGPATGQGPVLDRWYGKLSYHEQTRRALVVSWPTAAVFSIDVDTGDREIIVDLTSYERPSSGNRQFAVMDQAGETVFISPMGGTGLFSGLWMVDRVTGERVLAW